MSRFFYILLILSLGYFTISTAQDSNWKSVDEGLFVGEFNAPQKSITGDSRITIIKIDPDKYDFTLMCAGEKGHSAKTIRQWCQDNGLIAAVNAGMFQADHWTNVGYMKNYSYQNNARVHSQYFSVAAFDPVDTTKNPAFYMYDTDEQPMDRIIKQYHTVIQNLRLIKRPARNRWSQQNKRWSEVALGQDIDGNVLFIFSRSPYSMHDLNRILLELPIGVQCAQHLEGGPEASLYFSHNQVTIEKMGSYETGFTEHDHNTEYWPIPNIIGIRKKN